MMTAILVPGLEYPTQAPLLDLAGEALSDRRCAVEHVAWDVPGGVLETGPEPYVRAHVSAALYRAREAEPGRPVVVIAKSLGSYAAALVAERALPAVWLTPVLTDDSVVEAIAASPAPALLIGGGADPVWVPEAAEATGKQTLVIPGANHSLRVPGPLRLYAEALGTAATAMEEFLDALTGSPHHPPTKASTSSVARTSPKLR
jgi:hypothetical protein